MEGGEYFNDESILEDFSEVLPVQSTNQSLNEYNELSSSWRNTMIVAQESFRELLLSPSRHNCDEKEKERFHRFIEAQKEALALLKYEGDSQYSQGNHNIHHRQQPQENEEEELWERFMSSKQTAQRSVLSSEIAQSDDLNKAAGISSDNNDLEGRIETQDHNFDSFNKEISTPKEDSSSYAHIANQSTSQTTTELSHSWRHALMAAHESFHDLLVSPRKTISENEKERFNRFIKAQKEALLFLSFEEEGEEGIGATNTVVANERIQHEIVQEPSEKLMAADVNNDSIHDIALAESIKEKLDGIVLSEKQSSHYSQIKNWGETLKSVENKVSPQGTNVLVEENDKSITYKRSTGMEPIRNESQWSETKFPSFAQRNDRIEEFDYQKKSSSQEPHQIETISELLPVTRNYTCECCFEDLESDSICVQCNTGEHSFCSSCLQKYIEGFVSGESYMMRFSDDGFLVLPCLSIECDTGYILHNLVQEISPIELWEAYQERIFHHTSLEEGCFMIETPIRYRSSLDNKDDRNKGRKNEQEQAFHDMAEILTATKIRRCPTCRTPFLKEAGYCNKFRCPSCRTCLCYICGTIVSSTGYDHFCVHNYDVCSVSCGKCVLWTTQDEIQDDANLERIANDQFRMYKARKGNV